MSSSSTTFITDGIFYNLSLDFEREGLKLSTVCVSLSAESSSTSVICSFLF